VSISSRFCALLATVAACTSPSSSTDIAPFIDNGKADGHADHLHVLDDHRLDVDEPSDLASANGVMFTVSDAHSKIYAIDSGGAVTREVDIASGNLEALVAMPDGAFLVADETTAKIWHIDPSGARHDPIEIAVALDGNSGIEGLALLPDGGLLIAKEKHPARLIELDPFGTTLWDDKIHFASDVSALTYNPTDHHIYALSDEDASLYRLDSEFGVETAWKLPVKNPEGIVFDGSDVYVCSDSAARLYRFSIGD
jgi:uncharacterized protein YjiK